MSAILYMSVYGYVRGEVCVLVEGGEMLTRRWCALCWTAKALSSGG